MNKVLMVEHEKLKAEIQEKIDKTRKNGKNHEMETVYNNHRSVYLQMQVQPWYVYATRTQKHGIYKGVGTVLNIQSYKT